MNNKPYPCCGEEPRVFSLTAHDNKFWISYVCNKCGRAKGANTDASAISAWNALPHGWMRVEEYEPPEGIRILFWNDTNYPPIILGLTKGEIEAGFPTLTYWMPIPPLPKETA